MAQIGELLINIRASTAQIKTDLNSVKTSVASAMNSMQNVVSGAMTVISEEIGRRAVAAFTQMIYQSADAGDKLLRLAQQTGFTATSITAMGYAAKMADLDLDTFALSTARLEARLNEAASGNKRLRAEFLRFGIDPAKIKEPQEALEKLSATFSKMPDGVQKTAASMQFFGRAGFSMIPFLNLGPEAIKQLSKEAADLGIVLERKDLFALSRFHDEMKRMMATMDAWKMRMTADIAPTFTQIANLMLSTFSEHQSEIIAWLIKDMESFAEMVRATKIELQQLAATWRFLQTPVLKIGEGWDKYQAELRRIERENAPQGRRDSLFAALQARLASGEFDTRPKGGPPPYDLLADQVKKATTTFETMVEKIHEEEIAFIAGAKAAERMRLAHEGLSASQIKIIQQNEQNLASMKALAEMEPTLRKSTEQLDESFYKMREEGFGYWKESLNVFNLWYIKMERVKELYDANALSLKEYTDIVRQMRGEWDKMIEKGQQAGAKLKDAADQVKKAFERMITDSIFHASSFKDAMGRLLQTLGQIVFEVMVLQPLMEKLSKTMSSFGKGGGGGGGIFGFLGGLFGGLFGGGGGGGVGVEEGSFEWLGKFASGGRTFAGQPILVGERGPELFVPNATGTVVPSGKFGAQVTYNIDARGADAGVEERIRRALIEAENRAVQRSVIVSRDLALRGA